MMERVSSSASLLLLDPDLTDGDVFDPPERVPGRFLQFTDISLEDEHSCRRLSMCTAERVMSPLRETSENFVPFRSTAESASNSFVVHMQRRRSSCSGNSTTRTTALSRRHRFPTLLLPQWAGPKVIVMMTSCMTVALTALTLLTYVL